MENYKIIPKLYYIFDIMKNISKIRLYDVEKKALDKAIETVNFDVFVFGSRTGLTKKWWDIDILIINDMYDNISSIDIQSKFWVEFQKYSEQKVDIIVLPSLMSESQKSFYDNINKIQIKYKNR